MEYLPDGPSSYRESLCIVDSVLERLLATGAGEPCVDGVPKPIRVITDYSGAGGVEMAFSFFLQSLSKNGMQVPDVEIYRACDISAACREG